MTIDQIIALSTSIAAFFTAAAALLAVRQNLKQRQAAYCPELVICRTPFEGSSSPIYNSPLPSHWYTDKCKNKEKNYIDWFSVPLRNIGLGAAKEVLLEWSFEIEPAVEEVNLLAQRCLIPAYFKYDNGELSLKSESVGNFTSMWKVQKKAYLDYVLPATIDSKATKLKIPFAYIHLVSALVHFSVGAEEGMPSSNIPKLLLSTYFSDIGGIKHRAIFELTLSIVAIIGKGESFSGYFTSEKIS